MRISEEIHNYTEYLIGEQLAITGIGEKHDHDFISDLCCLVLNQIPPRYVRSDVDLLSYISDNERKELNEMISITLMQAEEFLEQDRREHPRGS
jgi:hypothetical protein